MESKIIKCPQCKIGLEVKNTRNEAVKSIKCPNCKTPLKVIFRQPQLQPPADPGATILPGMNTPQQHAGGGVTQLGPNQSQPGETQLGQITGGDATPIKPNLQPGRLFCNGREYPLQMGQNIVGRKNSTKPTTVMLDVNDTYMSRMHICINVMQVGTDIRATVTNYQNTNETKVAGMPLVKGEVIVLSNNMTITMGDTTVTYRAN